MTFQDVVDRVLGSRFGPYGGVFVALLTRCAWMGAVEPLARRFELRNQAPQKLQAAAKEFIDADKWRVPLLIQLSSLPACAIPVLYITAAEPMDETAWIVFILTSMPIALYNVCTAHGANNPLQGQPHVWMEWLLIFLRVFCALLVLYRIRECHNSEEFSSSSCNSEAGSEADEVSDNKDPAEPSNSNFMTPVSRLVHLDPDY